MEQASSSTRDRPARKRRLLVGVVLGVIALAAVVAAVLVFTADDTDEPPDRPDEVEAGSPVALSEDDLRSYARDLGTPVYWAGPRAETDYEVTRTEDASVFVRYLPRGTVAGDPRPRFLTVATYSTAGAYEFLRRQGRREGWSSQRTTSGALVAFAEETPTSVYFAFPNADLQVEVFAPQLDRARELVLGGDIAPVSG